MTKIKKRQGGYFNIMKFAQRKQKIPVALREQVWIRQNGRVFESSCSIAWCKNIITVFDFQSGHNIPESKGGSTTIDNLIPICSRCNLSMGNKYTIDEWTASFQENPMKVPIEIKPKKSFWCFF
jgi:5-methylcytosine-specific restriction endonuclease McrA